METLLIIAIVVVVGAIIYFNRSSKSLDINEDGKVDVADVKVATTKAKTAVKKAAVKAKTATRSARKTK